MKKKAEKNPSLIVKGTNGSALTKTEYLKLAHVMRLTREFEDTILRLYQQGKIVGGAYSGNGNEATSVGSAFALEATDYLFPMHRDIGAHLMKGQSILAMMRQHLGRGTSFTRGRDGTGHYMNSMIPASRSDSMA